ncbi:MAG: multiheme c-type cytochrome [Gammaproteobacteria bacterium]|nr:multiheme c-type cytochrome [Gammaproteobacteria bacterium]
MTFQLVQTSLQQRLLKLMLMMLLLIPFVAVAADAPVKSSNKKAELHKVLKGFEQLSKESAQCVSCHREKSPGIYQMWGESKHYRANVGCYECHKADPADKDAIKHKDHIISVIVSPKDCSSCHEKETREFDASHHASAGNILGSLDNVLAEVVEGAPLLHGTSPVVTSGCMACHGSIVRVESDGSLNAAGWPNTGIGRINPDGSKGACSACHYRHNFSAAQARHPDNCGRCHLGPDHPQKEIYEESVHGVAFRANIDKMNMDSAKWIVGEDYTAAPTCATCHMSATKDLPVTHDIGSRISWDLRSPVSAKIDAKAIAQGKKVKPWLERRQDMKNVCSSCHGRNIVDNFYEQLDSFVELFNTKFAIPAKELMTVLKKENLIDDTKFNDKVEWIYFYLWHHEGRRARHGAAMLAPDYVHWEGMFEVAHRFYMEMVPEIKTLIKEAKEHNKSGSDKAQAKLDEILDSEMHRWFRGKKPPKAWSPEDSDSHGYKKPKP